MDFGWVYSFSNYISMVRTFIRVVNNYLSYDQCSLPAQVLKMPHTGQRGVVRGDDDHYPKTDLALYPPLL